VDIVGLDRGHVLVYSDSEWKSRASCSSPDCCGPNDAPPSRNMLDRVLREKRTFWQGLKELDDTASLAGVDLVVASPILNPAGEVIGAIYGDCHQDALTATPKITQVE